MPVRCCCKGKKAECVNEAVRYLKFLLVLVLFGAARAELNGAALEAYLLAQRAYSAAIASLTPPNLKLAVWQKALNLSEKAVLAAPKEPEPLLLKAQLLTKLQVWQKAESAWRAYFAVTAGSSAAMTQMAEVQYVLALEARAQKKLLIAIGYFEQTVIFNPQKPRAWSWLGRSRYEAGRYVPAAEACLKALELNPGDSMAADYLKRARVKINFKPSN
jgi:tetratricopeptide (TPR) repeat protein